MPILIEDTRQKLIGKARAGADYKTDRSKGRNRYFRRTQCSISSTVKEYNNIDMNKLFKNDILDFQIKVHGENHNDPNYENKDYFVRLSFGGLIERLKEQLQQSNGKFDFRIIVRALIDCFNHDDVYIFCDCPDFKYRLKYFCSVNDLIIGEKETIPSDITNPDDKLGPACKHICLVLQNMSWIYKVAATINNYVNYMETHYSNAYKNVIYPALYGQDYEGSKANLSDDEMGTDTGLIKKSNEYGATRGQFKPGNKQGMRFASNDYQEPEQPEEEV